MSDPVAPAISQACIDCLKVVTDAEVLALDVLAVLKGGIGAEIKGAFAIFADLRKIVADARVCLPEAKNLSADDAGYLASAVADSASKVIAQFGK